MNSCYAHLSSTSENPLLDSFDELLFQKRSLSRISSSYGMASFALLERSLAGSVLDSQRIRWQSVVPNYVRVYMLVLHAFFALS